MTIVLRASNDVSWYKRVRNPNLLNDVVKPLLENQMYCSCRFAVTTVLYWRNREFGFQHRLLMASASGVHPQSQASSEAWESKSYGCHLWNL